MSALGSHTSAGRPHRDQPSFRAERWIVGDWVKSALVRLPCALQDASDLAQREVLVDGIAFRCMRVHTAGHAPPFRAGEMVALLVEAPAD